MGGPHILSERDVRVFLELQGTGIVTPSPTARRLVFKELSLYNEPKPARLLIHIGTTLYQYT